MAVEAKLRRCQVEGCYSKAKYGLYRTDSKGNKEWLHVCPLDEGQIGAENLKRAGGYYEGKKGKVI